MFYLACFVALEALKSFFAEHTDSDCAIWTSDNIAIMLLATDDQTSYTDQCKKKNRLRHRKGFVRFITHRLMLNTVINSRRVFPCLFIPSLKKTPKTRFTQSVGKRARDTANYLVSSTKITLF